MDKEQAFKQLKQPQSQRLLIVLNRLDNKPFNRSMLCAETGIPFGTISRVLVALEVLGVIEKIGQKLFIKYEDALKLAQTARERYPDLNLSFDPEDWRLDYNRKPDAARRGGQGYSKTRLWPEVFAKIAELGLVQNVNHVEKRREVLMAARAAKGKR